MKGVLVNGGIGSALPRVILALLGVWLVIGHYILGFGVPESKANDAIIGFFIVFFALSRLIPQEDSVWASWLATALGLWSIAAPFIFGYSDESSSLMNNVIVGVLVVLLGIWTGRPSTRTTHAHH